MAKNGPDEGVKGEPETLEKKVTYECNQFRDKKDRLTGKIQKVTRDLLDRAHCTGAEECRGKRKNPTCVKENIIIIKEGTDKKIIFHPSRITLPKKKS